MIIGAAIKGLLAGRNRVSLVGVTSDQFYLTDKKNATPAWPAGTRAGDRAILIISSSGQSDVPSNSFPWQLVYQSGASHDPSLRFYSRVIAASDLTETPTIVGTGGNAGSCVLFVGRSIRNAVVVQPSSGMNSFPEIASSASFFVSALSYQNRVAATWTGVPSSIFQFCQGNTSRSITVGYGRLSGGKVPARSVALGSGGALGYAAHILIS